MSRIRTVKPEFWTDATMVQLPFEARLLFIGLWNFADDAGYLPDEPEELRLQVLPADVDLDGSALLDLLVAAGRLERYADEEGSYLRIRHFLDHQRIDHPSKSKIVREGSRKVAIPQEVRRAVAKKYGCAPGEEVSADCFYCGEQGHIRWWLLRNGRPSKWVSFSNLELDHFEPEALGGEATDENIVLACRSCNRSKSTKHALDSMKLRTDYGRAQPISLSPREEPENPPETSRLKGMEGKGSGGEGKHQDLGAAKSPAPHRRDECWEAFLDVTGVEGDRLSTERRKALNGMLAAIKRAGASPEEIRRRAENWPFEVPLTPEGLTKRWAELGRPRTTNTRPRTGVQQALAEANRLRSEGR